MASFPVLQVTEGDWKSVGDVEILGSRIAAHVISDPQLFCDFILNFQTRSDDVFVVGFPKSGTTWMQEIVWQIFNEGEVNSEKDVARVPFLELATNPIFTNVQPDITTMPSPRLLKTHFIYDAIPKSANKDAVCKYIYIARNPKDVAVSYFEFASERSLVNGYNGPWEFFVKLFIEGSAGWGKWSDHVLGWWKHKDDPNVLFLKYEDLQKDLLSHVRMIANFLNKPLSDDLISRIADQCTFRGMKKNAASYATIHKGVDSSMLRKGVVGDWKNYFTPELNERFEKEVLATLKGSGLEFDFGLHHISYI